MIDLKKIKLSDTIYVNGSFFNIKTDFRNWLLFAELVNDESVTYDDFDFLFTDEVPADKVEAFNQLILFFNPPKELPRYAGGSDEIILDYQLDADLIYSAFLEVYGIDLLETTPDGKIKVFMHWHKFTALLNGLHNTKLNEIMSYRCYEPKGDDSQYSRDMMKLKTQWRLPQNLKLSKETEEWNSLFSKK